MTTEHPTMETAMEYLQADHRRLDGLMERCRAGVASGDVKGAAALFDEFRNGLRRHIRIEEELLFPEFESVTGLGKTGGPTGVMRLEHEEILRLLDLIHGLFEAPQSPAADFEPLRTAVIGLLHEHNGKEERIIYPMTDRMTPPPRLRELVSRMKRYA